MANKPKPGKSTAIAKSPIPASDKPRGSKAPEEIGATGLIQYSGYIYEEQLLELANFRWPKIVRQMLTNAIIGSIFAVIEYLMRQADWPIVPTDANKPEDVEAQEFIQECLGDMQFTWQDILGEIVSMLPWGYSVFENVLKLRNGQQPGTFVDASGKTQIRVSSKFSDGRIGWAKWAPRAQETLLHWEFDDVGNATHMVQLPPPDYRQRMLPLDKCLHFKSSAHKLNPEGKSLCRMIYTEWYYSTNLNRIEAIGIERNLAGLPRIRVPSSIFPTTGESPGPQLQMYINMGENLRKDEQAYVLLPSDRYGDDGKGELMYDIDLMGSAGEKETDTKVSIERHELRMAQGLLADFVMLGHEKVGSFALADSKTSLFAVAMGAFMDTICATINKSAIDKLLSINGMTGSCEMTHGDLEHVDLQAVSLVLAQFAANGIILTDEEKKWIKKVMGFPQSETESAGGGTDEEIDRAEEAEIKSDKTTYMLVPAPTGVAPAVPGAKPAAVPAKPGSAQSASKTAKPQKGVNKAGKPAPGATVKVAAQPSMKSDLELAGKLFESAGAELSALLDAKPKEEND